MKKEKIIILLLLVFCLTVVSPAGAQDVERQILDGSALAAGQSFRFSVTADSDEDLTFMGSLPELSAVLCPVGAAESDCMTMSMEADRKEGTSVRFSFLVEELPAAGDYTLDILFSDSTRTFGEKSAAYLIRGVREEVSVETRKVTLRPELLDENGTSMIYGNTVYINQPYTLRIAADSALNDSVVLNAAIPASLSGVSVDPYSECLKYMNADRTALQIPGSAWNSSNDNIFTCQIRFTDTAWVSPAPIVFTLETPEDSSYKSGVIYEMDPLSWNYYPVSVTKIAATHQVQITDSRGNLVCSDTVPCGAFNADEVYTLTYKMPADWGVAVPSGKRLSARITFPSEWTGGLQSADELMLSGIFAPACEPDPNGVLSLTLDETSAGRYSASCSFVPGGVINPVQAAATVHLNDDSYQVSDLSVWMPPAVNKPKVSLTPSLTLQTAPGSEASEQIQNGALGALRRSFEEYPNTLQSGLSPALYTLKAEISGVSTSRSPQMNDAVLVNWPVLDHLAQTGDLPSCLTPASSGYYLGDLVQTEDGNWSAECAFYFPRTMDTSIPASTLEMQLLSGAYQTSSRVAMNVYPFSRQPLYVDLDIPARMLLMQPSEIHVRLSDESGGVSDYLRAILAAGPAELYSSWDYSYLTDCQGVFSIDADGEAVCSASFTEPTAAASAMQFSMNDPRLSALFNVEYRPGASVIIPAVAAVQTEVTPHLDLQMRADSEPAEQISDHKLGLLYRSVGDFPNAYTDSGAPALYTLRAVVSGVITSSVPQADDYVLVKWPLLDSLAQTGDLPSCLVPVSEGYMLGQLADNGAGSWEASCSFRFPQTMSTAALPGMMEMQLRSAAYQGSASVEMKDDPFRMETLYVDLDVPDMIRIGQNAAFTAHLSDGSGGLSEYLRAVLDADQVSLYGDWVYNYLTDCQGLYEFNGTDDASCSAYFIAPTEGDSTLHLSLESSTAGSLYDVVYRPGSDVLIPAASAVRAVLSVRLLHAGEEIMIPASDTDNFEVGDNYQLQFILQPDERFSAVTDEVSVDYEGRVLDWDYPLVIQWPVLPDSPISLNFYRDGDHFTARYDFSFSAGDMDLTGGMNMLTTDVMIEGWIIDTLDGTNTFRLPARVGRKPLKLSFSDFTSDGGVTYTGDLTVGQEAWFDVNFSGSMETMDFTQMLVGYTENGVNIPLDCYADTDGGVFRCSIIPVCMDDGVSADASVCSSDLSLYAVYNGDPVNTPAEAVSKPFHIKRAGLEMTPVPESSLSVNDLVRIQAASDDLQYMGYGSLNIGGWNVDSFLPRQTWTSGSDIWGAYPVVFRYVTAAADGVDRDRFRLDVTVETGNADKPDEAVISLPAFMVSDDTVTFLLDFGSLEILDDGRLAGEALQNAVTIKSMTARYLGSAMVSPARCAFESEGLEFAVKVADFYEMEADAGMPDMLSFGGAFTDYAPFQPYTVWCSQLWEPLQCSSQQPAEAASEAVPGESGSEDGTAAAAFKDEGCWGSLQIRIETFSRIYISSGFNPQCYLTARESSGKLLIASNVR